MNKIPIETIKAHFTYDPITGIILRNSTQEQPSNPRSARLNGYPLELSHIAWAIYYEEWPLDGWLVDHKDRNPRNNAIDNLRLATYSQNGINMAVRNPYGVKGITFDGTRVKCWRAQIRIKGRKVNLGRFENFDAAVEAYCKAAFEHHGEFVCLE